MNKAKTLLTAIKKKANEKKKTQNAARLILPVKTYIAVTIIILIIMAIPPLLYCGVSIADILTIKSLEAVAFYVFSAFICYNLIIRYLNKHYVVHLQTLSDAFRKVANGDLDTKIETDNFRNEHNVICNLFSDFNATVKELSSTEKMKDDFVITVAHEMKTPLAIIKNYTVALQNTELTQTERDRYVVVISESADRFSSLITHILQLNKIETRAIKPQKKNYDLCRQICNCILPFESIWEQKSIDICVETEEKREVNAAPENIELILNNLLSNAFKFTPCGGCVTLTEQCSNDTVTISITDNGCGMDEQTKKHIFEKFYRGNSNVESDGNGLGLALVKAIAEENGYEIEVESEPNRGSVFRIVLPVS